MEHVPSNQVRIEKKEASGMSTLTRDEFLTQLSAAVDALRDKRVDSPTTADVRQAFFDLSDSPHGGEVMRMVNNDGSLQALCITAVQSAVEQKALPLNGDAAWDRYQRLSE